MALSHVRSELSAADARRLALASLGFGAKKPRRAGAAHVRATAHRLGAIQIDSVNVLARAHYLPTFSRYGPYPMSALDDLVHVRRELFEYWGHAACFLPIDLYPLLRWRMERQCEAWAGVSRKQRDFLAAVHDELAERGPLSASELSNAGKSKGPWWGWSDGKEALELLFRSRELAALGLCFGAGPSCARLSGVPASCVWLDGGLDTRPRFHRTVGRSNLRSAGGSLLDADLATR